MDVSKQQYLKELLDKYMSGGMTTDELKILKQAVNIHTDEELGDLLDVEWQQFSDMRPIDTAVQKEMLAKIRQRTNHESLFVWNKKGMRIAASIVIILLTSLSLYLYHGNREMSQLGDRNVVVKVGKGERVSITLPDGTSVRLNSESELAYQQDFGLKDRRVSLTGEGFFDVVKNKERQFVVNTQYLDVKVLGTAFNIYTYQNSDSVEMTLVRGHVEVTATHPPYQTMDVQPNEKVVYNKRTGKMRLENTSNEFETAWMNHELVFRSARLGDVLNRVGRKYGFTVEVDDTLLLKDVYTGVFDEAEINDVMQILKAHFGFTYRIKENVIWIERSTMINQQ